MSDSTRFVGLDVHRDTVAIAVAPAVGEVEFVTELPNDLGKLRKFFEKLRAQHPLRVCYEAGCCGYVLQRALSSWGIACEVIAPSLIPTRPGDRRKTDARDARNLAIAYRGGSLTAVRVPSEGDERVRGLTRAREGLTKDAHETRQHILKFLLLRGHAYREGKAWTQRFSKWLAALLPTLEPLDPLVLSTHVALLEQKEMHRRNLDEKIEEVSKQSPFREPVERLRCLRGVDTLTALSLLVEIGDVRRFGSPRRLMGYLGLSVSERSSGATQRRGGITKAGNSRCRRLLVEAAWSYRHAPKDSIKIKSRRVGKPAEVLACAVRAQQRLHSRFVRLLERMPSQKAVTAVARELVGFVWALLQGTPEAMLPKPTR